MQAEKKNRESYYTVFLIFRKMNIEQSTMNTIATEAVATSVATPEGRSTSNGVVALRDVSAERISATSPPSNNFLASSATDMAPAVPGMPSAEKLNTAPIIGAPSLGSKEEMISSSISAPNESPAATSDNGAFSLAPSIISQASTLSSKQAAAFNPEATEPMRPDDINRSVNENDLKHEGYSSPSSSSTNEIDDDVYESSPMPAYIACIGASPQSIETIFTARKKELHFLSDIFRREHQSWLLEDELDSDDEDSNDDDDEDNNKDQDDNQHGFTEYSGRTNFVQRNGAYRKPHEIGPLLFAKTLDLDDGVI